VIAWLGLALSIVPACGDNFEGDTNERCEGDTSLPCNEDPWACEAGTNCWIGSSGDVGCFDIGTTGLAEPCAPALGASTCAQDMACVQITGEPEGYCRAFCDSTNPCKTCPDTKNCVPVTLPNGASLNVCLPS
jgi:hypothetical protein